MCRPTLPSKANISGVEVARRTGVDVLELLEKMAGDRADSHVHCGPNRGLNVQV